MRRFLYRFLRVLTLSTLPKQLILLALVIVSTPSRSDATTPPPGSVQVFFDDFMQSNSRSGSSWILVEFKVLAYELSGDVQAYRFRFTPSDTSVAFFGGFPDGVQNVGSGRDYVLETTGACLDGSGIVELGSGAIFALPGTSVRDLTLCLGPVSNAPEGESGLDYRTCGSDTWTPMTLLYPGCAVANPVTVVPADIPDNDPNALWITSIALVQDEPTDLVTLPFRGSKVLQKSSGMTGDPTQVGHLALELQWDPAVATYESLWTVGGTAWQVTATPGPGTLAVDMHGTTALNPPVAPDQDDWIRVTYRLADREQETPVAVDFTAVEDLTGAPIPFIPTGVPVLRITCVKGDVIRNLDINALDAVMALQFAAQLRTPDAKEFCRADLNLNGLMDAGDAVLILRKAVGLPKRLDGYLDGSPTVDPRATAEAVWVTVDVAGAAGADVLATWDAAGASLVAWEASGALAGGAAAERREPGELQLALARGPIAADEDAATGTGVAPGADAAPGAGSAPSAEPGPSAEPAPHASASVRLAFDHPAVVTLQRLQLWDEAGQLLADRSGELLRGEVPGGDVPGGETGATAARPVRLVAVAPNPFNPATQIVFEAARAGWARLSVFDARGRRVWTRWMGATVVGVNRVRWDGSDARGVPLASGRYEVVVETEDGRDSVGVTVVR